MEGLKEKIVSEGGQLDEVQGSISILARAVRFGDADKVDSLKDSKDFAALKKYFSELD